MRFSPDALYEAALALEMTGDDLASAAGVEYARVAAFLRGEDSPTVVEASGLATAVGVKVSDLYVVDPDLGGRVLRFPKERARRRPTPFRRRLADVIPIRKGPNGSGH